MIKNFKKRIVGLCIFLVGLVFLLIGIFLVRDIDGLSWEYLTFFTLFLADNSPTAGEIIGVALIDLSFIPVLAGIIQLVNPTLIELMLAESTDEIKENEE